MPLWRNARRYFKIARHFLVLQDSQEPLRCARRVSSSSILDSLSEVIARLNGYAPEPSPKKVSSCQRFHGVDLEDDFAWLQDPNSKDVKKYIGTENRYSEAALAKSANFQHELIHEIAHWAHITPNIQEVPQRLGNYAYYVKSPPEEYSHRLPLFCRKRVHSDGSYGAPEIILNQNELARMCTYVGIIAFKLSPSRKLAAFILDSEGHEKFSGHVMKVRYGPLETTDALPNVVNLEWGHDDRTIFYTTADDRRRPNKVWKHIVGQDPINDLLVFEERDDRFCVDVSCTKDKSFITINSNSKSTSEVSTVCAKDAASPQPHVFRTREQGVEYYVDHRKGEFFIVTNANSMNYKVLHFAVRLRKPCYLATQEATFRPQTAMWRHLVVRADPQVMKVKAEHPEKENWTELLPQRPNVIIDDMDLFEHYCVLYERQGTVPQLTIVPLDNPEQYWTVKLPEKACVLEPGSNQMFRCDVVRFALSSPVLHPHIMEYNMKTRTMSDFTPRKKLDAFKNIDHLCSRIEIPSKDGTMVPVTVFHDKSVKMNGQNPMLLHVYGAYGMNVNMAFAPERMCLLSRGWVLAFCHVRGGGELGREWYRQGRLQNKHKSLEDFEACIEGLHKLGYSNPTRTAARGVSAGGLTVAAVCNRSPVLLQAAVLKVPFIDMLTAMLDPSLPLTTQEYEEWGDPRSNDDDFHCIRSYCPYQNITEQVYPSMYVTTSMLDTRVPYWLPIKWVAKLRSMAVMKHGLRDLVSPHEPTILCHVDSQGGHFGEENGTFDEVAREYAFLFKALHLPCR